VQAAAVRGLTPLVGRRSEIEVFSKLIEEAASGKGQILAMVGEPRAGQIAPGARIYSAPAPAGLASAGGRLGVLRPSDALFSIDRNVAPLLSDRRWRRKRQHPGAGGDAYFGTGQHAQECDPADPFPHGGVARRGSSAGAMDAIQRGGRRDGTIPRDGPPTAASLYLRGDKAGARPREPAAALVDRL